MHDTNRPSNEDQATRSESTALRSQPLVIVFGALLAVAFGWLYWPTFAKLVHTWNVEPDYSHGYLVIPVALYFLYARRDQMPAATGPAWGGLVLVLTALAMNVLGNIFFIDALDGWSLPLWVGGVVWLLAGRGYFLWCLPSLAFLWFMVPLPFKAEQFLSLELQRVATRISCWMLQFLGLPALAQGNVIHIGDVPLTVAEACSGLRIFVSIVALAFAYSVLVRRPWWIKALLFASVVPIALIANAVRVTLIGVLYTVIESEEGRQRSHDVAGLLVIPLAAALMGLFLWYLGKLIVEVRVVSQKELLRTT